MEIITLIWCLHVHLLIFKQLLIKQTVLRHIIIYIYMHPHVFAQENQILLWMQCGFYIWQNGEVERGILPPTDNMMLVMLELLDQKLKHKGDFNQKKYCDYLLTAGKMSWKHQGGSQQKNTRKYKVYTALGFAVKARWCEIFIHSDKLKHKQYCHKFWIKTS